MNAMQKRVFAIDAYASAQAGADWQAIANALAAVIPTPKAAKAGPEFCEYTAAQHKGRGNLFHANISALFEFADGVVIAAPLRHRCSMPMPDWARAARFAVRFYRLKLARELLDVTDREWGCLTPCAEEAYATKCAIPEIVAALDESRGVMPDLGQINAATHALREGHEFMAGWDGSNLKEAALAALYGPSFSIAT